MEFEHTAPIWRDFPELVAGGVYVEGIDDQVDVDELLADLHREARAALAITPEGQRPEIQAWRRTFARMGLKPTQYRCAAESLLRRFRKEDALPRIHPLVDLLNAFSLAYALPIAVFDLDRVDDRLEVRYADGDETYLTFAGAEERPHPGEVIFADAARHAHARRWTHRQSARSSITERTVRVLIMIEAVHESAAADVPLVVDQLIDRLGQLWLSTPQSAVLTAAHPRLTVCRGAIRR
jgi:DNA/RNA-binding domain of Phe-tRNA-synthetase-like protein